MPPMQQTENAASAQGANGDVQLVNKEGDVGTQRRLSRRASVLGALRRPAFFKRIVRSTMNAFVWKSTPDKENFNSQTWKAAFFRRKSEIYSSQTEPEEEAVEKKVVTTKTHHVEESVDLVPAIQYVQARMNEKEKKVGITRFDLVQLLALRPRNKLTSQGVHDLYCTMHSNIHTRCWEFEPKCRMTGKDFDNFWVRRKQEEEYHVFLRTYAPGENVMLTEGLIRVIEKCNEWPVIARSLQLLTTICINSRPVVAFCTLISDKGFRRIWRHVRTALQQRDGDDPAEYADKLKAWWSFVFALLKDAHAANVIGGTSDPDNYFFDPLVSNKKAVRIISPAEVVTYIWETYHPRNVLYAIGNTATTNNDSLEVIAVAGWRILDLGAVEFLAQKSVGGIARLRTIMEAFTTIKWSFNMPVAELRVQLSKIKSSTSKLESMLKSDPTFCLTAALYGMPFFLELIEWWIRECPAVLSTPELRTLATSITGNLKIHFDKMEKYVHYIYRGDEDTEDRNDGPILKAREARNELHKVPTNFRTMVLSSINVTKRLIFNSPVEVPEVKPSPRKVADEGKDESERPDSPINVEAENAWEALLRVIGK